MKSDKVTVTIKVESLSIDTLSGMLAMVIEQVKNEFESGSLVANDGDEVEWSTERKGVEF